MRYRKKPPEIEVWEIGSNEPYPDWIHFCGDHSNDDSGLTMHVMTPYGSMICKRGDVIARDEDGYIEVITKAELEKSYEVVE